MPALRLAEILRATPPLRLRFSGTPSLRSLRSLAANRIRVLPRPPWLKLPFRRMEVNRTRNFTAEKTPLFGKETVKFSSWDQTLMPIKPPATCPCGRCLLPVFCFSSVRDPFPARAQSRCPIGPKSAMQQQMPFLTPETSRQRLECVRFIAAFSLNRELLKKLHA